MTIDAVNDAGGGLLDVDYTVTNQGFSDATAFTVGFFVDPNGEPVVGQLADATADITTLPQGMSSSGTVQLTATQASLIIGFADVTGVVDETNEGDNLAVPPPLLVGAIEASPTTVDEGTLLTLRIPVNGSARSAEVYLGDGSGAGTFLGNLYGNDPGQGTPGFLEGSVTVPPGTASLGTAAIGVILHDVTWSSTAYYTFVPSVSLTNLAVSVDTASPWIDSGVPITFIDIIPPTRPNLVVTIDSIVDAGGGAVDVTYTVQNVGAGDAGSFDVGLFIDPAAIPVAGDPATATVALTGLAVGGSFTDTLTFAAPPTSAFFAYADLGNAVDEQLETDNLGWSIPPPQMTGQPTPSAATVAEGSPFTVTVPISAGVRRVEVYVGGMMGPTGGPPAFLLGEAALGGSAASVDVPCTAPAGTAGDWYLWVATYDTYGIVWRGYVPFDAVSTTLYTEYDPSLGGPPSVPTAIPLTQLTITP